MHYVGLSRVRNSSSLHILNLNEKKIKVSEKVANEMERLRMEACLVPTVSLKPSPNATTIIFQNVRSLHLHIKDVRSDYNFKKAHVNIFVETRLCASDNDEEYSIEKFNIYRNDFNQSRTRSSYGSVMYVAPSLPIAQTPQRFNLNIVEITIMVTDTPIQHLHIVGVYRSKSLVKISELLNALKNLHETILSNATPTCLLGDFNVNLLEDCSETNTLSGYLIQEKGYTQLIKQPTTDYHTLLDHIYTNVPDIVMLSGALESYYSDHKPIFVH